MYADSHLWILLEDLDRFLIPRADEEHGGGERHSGLRDLLQGEVHRVIHSDVVESEQDLGRVGALRVDPARHGGRGGKKKCCKDSLQAFHRIHGLRKPLKFTRHTHFRSRLHPPLARSGTGINVTCEQNHDPN